MNWDILERTPWPEPAIEVLKEHYGTVAPVDMIKLLQPHFPKFRIVTRNMVCGKAHRLGLKHPRARGGKTCQPKP